MGRTLFCDCCGQDIRAGHDLYRVDKIPISIRNEKDMFDAIEKSKGIKDEEPYIICSDCFGEVGRRMQEMQKAIDFEVVTSQKEK